jgi:hypothetical protein
MTTNLAVRLARRLMLALGTALLVMGAAGRAEPMSRWGGTR